MAEKEQEHLRIRLGARLLKKIDSAREKSGRTRTDEIEARLIESFTRLDIELAAELAVHNVLERIDRIERAREQGAKPVDFYEALVGQFRKDKGEEK